jgi:crotonobetainyl-CoA:carnitine CoA-transferase CaiB-like acyl-CoA transferase
MPVNSYKDVFDNEHARQRKIEIEGASARRPGSHGAECRLVRQGWTAIDWMAPLLGEQTVEILSQCGYARMRSSG